MGWNPKLLLSNWISIFLRILLITLVILTFAFVLQVFNAFRFQKKYEEKRQWSHSLTEYSHLIVEMETNQRGFILSKDESFLYQYDVSYQKFLSLESELSETVEKSFEIKWNKIKKLSSKKIQFMNSKILDAKQSSKTSLYSKFGKQIMEDLQNHIKLLLEEKIYSDTQYRRGQERLNIIYLSVSGLGFLIFSFVLVWFRTILKSNKKIKLLNSEINDNFIEIDDVYQNSPVGFHSLDSNGFFVKINKTELSWLGYSEQELIGKKKWSDLLTEDSLRVFQNNYSKFKEDGFIHNLRFEVIRKDGNILNIDLSATAIYDSSGKFIQSRSVLVDVTKIVEYQRELLLARKKAEEANLAKTEFLSNMSHELRTPLNAVIGLSTLLLDENPLPSQIKTLQSLKFSSETLLSLINDILDFSKIEEKKVILEKLDIDIEELFFSISDLFAFRAKEKLLDFDSFFDPKLPKWIKGDPTRILQILNNLLSNALKFTKNGGIQFKGLLKQNGSKVPFVQFQIIDTGIGIPKKELSSVFEKFTQVSVDTTRKYGGSGLGLSISKALAELMNGSISLTSREGFGSTFSFEIPLIVGTGKIQLKSKFEEIDINILKGKKVIVADDIELNREIVIRFLSKWGIKSIPAENGLEVIDLISEHNPDLILLDIHMPIMDGYMVANTIRSEDRYLNLPIIALTASAQLETHEKIKKVGMNDYISKPFVPKDLFQKLIKWMIDSKEK